MSTYLSSCPLVPRHFDRCLLHFSTNSIDSHNALGNAGIERDQCLQTPVSRQIGCRHGLAATSPCRSNRIHADTCDKSVWKNESIVSTGQCLFQFIAIYHVITAAILFNAGLAFRTRFGVLCDPFAWFGVIGVFPTNQPRAWDWLMPIFLAIKAEIVAAFARPWRVGVAFNLFSGRMQTVYRHTPLYCFVVLQNNEWNIPKYLTKQI